MTTMQNYQHTVLITGANRGIGLEFARQYASDGWQVIACCREPKTAHELNGFELPNLQVMALDVANAEQIKHLAQQLNGAPIDVLINNAGVYPSKSINQVDWQSAFNINVIAPFMLTDALQPNLQNGQLKTVATLSSKMGSIDDNTSGGSYMYRSTKCAVNMVMKSLSIDLAKAGIAVVTLHPGWVQTDMGGSNAMINTQTSVAGLRKVIANTTLTNTGKFIAFDGKEIAW
jgi:NAD(P)-dependent dehydrogenase (short-subunit alcohol dehydrogenase family)